MRAHCLVELLLIGIRPSDNRTHCRSSHDDSYTSILSSKQIGRWGILLFVDINRFVQM